MSKPAAALKLRTEDRDVLEDWLRAGNTPQGVGKHIEIVLLAADGMSNSRIAGHVGVSRPTVIEWRKRYWREGADSLWEIRPGRGRKPQISAQRIREVVRLTTDTVPHDATHWSCRTMASKVGLSAATVQRIWSAHGLKPHLVGTFKVSRDPDFTDKLIDVVGLYLHPPDKAVVLCVDEKSQVQALDRTQPGLPLGRAGAMTHDYKRNGTTTLFAALNTLDATVVGQCLPRHRHQEFSAFLRTLDRSYPDSDLHLIVDNYGARKHPNVVKWLQRHPRFQLHFIPTSSSWLNLVERWFRDLTDRRIRRDSFGSVGELVSVIDDYIKQHNEDPQPFKWTKTAELVIERSTAVKSFWGHYTRPSGMRGRAAGGANPAGPRGRRPPRSPGASRLPRSPGIWGSAGRR